MLNSIYELGKLWVENDESKKENIKKDSDNMIENFDFLVDFNRLNYTKNVLFIDIKIDKDNNYNYDSVKLEKYSKNMNTEYFYKEGANGIIYSPSALIKDKKKKDSSYNKIPKWFKDNSEKNEMINKIHILFEEKNKQIKSDFNEYFKSIPTKDRNNTLITIRFEDNAGNTKFLKDYPIFKEIVVQKARNKCKNDDLDKTSKKNEHIISRCYLCDENKEMYSYVLNYLRLSYGTTDKLGNLPDFKKENNWKQASICKDCVLYLEAGKKFIEKYLSFSESEIQYYVIPTFFFNKKKVFNKMYKEFKNAENKRGYLGLAIKEERFIKIVNKMNDILEFKFLFYKKEQNSFRILGYVESILPSRLQKIYKSQKNVKDLFIFNEDSMQFTLDNNSTLIEILSNKDKYPLNQDYWYLRILNGFTSPKIKKDKDNDSDNIKDNNTVDNKYFVQIVTSILSGNLIDYNLLLKKILNKIRKEIYLKNKILEYDMLKSLLLILFISDLKLFKGDKNMSLDNIITDNEKIDEIKKMDISEEDKENMINIEISKNILDMLNESNKKSCFLLGVLTRKITAIQYNRLHSTPFLKKLWGLNLDYKKLIKVYSMVLSKLVEYGSLHSFENIEELLSYNLIKSGEEWNLSNDEISYYFLLGYTMGRNFKLETKEENKKEGEDDE